MNYLIELPIVSLLSLVLCFSSFLLAGVLFLWYTIVMPVYECATDWARHNVPYLIMREHIINELYKVRVNL